MTTTRDGWVFEVGAESFWVEALSSPGDPLVEVEVLLANVEPADRCKVVLGARMRVRVEFLPPSPRFNVDDIAVYRDQARALREGAFIVESGPVPPGQAPWIDQPSPDRS